MRILASLAVISACLAARAGNGPDPAALAAKIDLLLASRFEQEGVVPAPPADDAEFFRRLHLDLVGRIPPASDVRAFLADADPDERDRWVDLLLDDARHSVHLAYVWRALLIPETEASRDAAFFRPGFEAWLRQRRREDVPYDALVRELVAAPMAGPADVARPVFRDPTAPNPLAFFAVKDAKPENLAATTTRLFLGVQIECAQCHDHPFGRWSRTQFWNQAAFFAGIERRGKGAFAPLTEATDRRTIVMAEVGDVVPVAFLDGPAEVPVEGSPREALAAWMTSPGNTAFARAAANRVWGQLMGRGLVDPVDDFHDANPPSHPELLDALAADFAASGFDLTYLYAAICRSDAYRRTSATTDPSQTPRRFARMEVKGLSGDQFYDSLVLATGYRPPERRAAFGRDRDPTRERVLAAFSGAAAADPQTSVLQALTLMNGDFGTELTSPETGPTVIAAAETPGLANAERVDAMYLAALGRFPTAEERDRSLEYLGDATDSLGRKLGDILWSLLNSAEFRLNH